jgi:hypothetical protein
MYPHIVYEREILGPLSYDGDTEISKQQTLREQLMAWESEKRNCKTVQSMRNLMVSDEARKKIYSHPLFHIAPETRTGSDE